MSRLVGTVSRGIRAPIIREGDDIAKIVTESVLAASADEEWGFRIRNRDVIAMTGPENTFVGMGIGIESDEKDLISRPVLRYELLLPDDIPARTFVPKIKEIEASDPLLKLEFKSESSDGRNNSCRLLNHRS